MEPRLDKDGVALKEDDGSTMMVIDCEATQAFGGCPYTRELDKQDKTLLGNPVHGMFGTDCWYRGKYGNYLVEGLGVYDETLGFSFYGALGDGNHKSPHECNILADGIDEAIEHGDHSLNDEEVKDSKYASWYLKWAAEFTDGLVCWY
jgi:hypothetical protein